MLQRSRPRAPDRRPTTIPRGPTAESSRRGSRLPSRVATPMREDAWDAREASATRDEWDYRLDARERREIRDAGRRLVDSGASMEEIASSAAASALSPALSQRFETIRKGLLTGRGFALIRGVPVEDAGPEERAAMALCLGSQFGKLLPQNGKGHVLGHVKDIGLDASNPNHRIYATRAAQPFHTDSADLVGLLCLRKAKRGGLSSFCSSTRIFHDIFRERPDLASVLLRPFFVDRKGEIPPGKLPFYELAIFHRTRQGRVVGIMDRSFIQGKPWDHHHNNSTDLILPQFSPNSSHFSLVPPCLCLHGTDAWELPPQRRSDGPRSHD